METELVNISKIKKNPSNPRIIKDDKYHKLTQSIKEFPQMLFLRPIVVNEEMMVLGGNMRLKACKEAGLKEVPVIKARDLTEEQQREFIIKDNVGFGEWDWDLLANEWDTDLLEDWGLDAPLYAIEEIEEIGEKANFIIQCHTFNEMENVQTILSERGTKIDAATFIKVIENTLDT